MSGLDPQSASYKNLSATEKDIKNKIRELCPDNEAYKALFPAEEEIKNTIDKEEIKDTDTDTFADLSIYLPDHAKKSFDRLPEKAKPTANRELAKLTSAQIQGIIQFKL